VNGAGGTKTNEKKAKSKHPGARPEPGARGNRFPPSNNNSQETRA
jgi:hypothetical protein